MFSMIQTPVFCFVGLSNNLGMVADSFDIVGDLRFARRIFMFKARARGNPYARYV